MRRNPRWLVLFLAFITLVLAEHTVWGQASRSTLIVLGFDNEVRGQIWKDARIGFGLSTLFGQLLYESGCFRPIEEKSEVLARVKSIQSSLWAKSGPNPQILPFSRLAHGWKTDWTAYGTVLSARRVRSRSFISLFSTGKETVTVNLKASLASANGQKVISASGKGSSSFKATAVGFTIQRRQVLFDETTVGRATKAALESAVKRLLTSYGKETSGC